MAPVARGRIVCLMTHDTKIHNVPRISPVTLGRYRIAALPWRLVNGRYAAQVSIASGTGSATTDRVMRFHDDFPTYRSAARYALAQGLRWVRATH
jgi:hypothetical protein